MKNCNQCGKCCIKYGDGGLSASAEDIALWELFNPEIFDFVKGDQIWFDPVTKVQLTRCPFLEILPATSPTTATKYTCAIYDSRPEDCRHYPSLIAEMVRDECEMIEAIDLQNPNKAQRRLDVLMIDSRPSDFLK